MAVNRASNSRFMGWDGCKAARPETRRRLCMSNFTATLRPCLVLVSRFYRATSTIIERIRDRSYELWKVASAFWDAIGAAKRRREEGFGCWVSLRGLADFVVGVFLKCSEDDVPKPFIWF